MTKFLSILETVAVIFLSAAVSFLAAWYWFVRGAKARAAETLAAATLKLEQRVVELEARLGLLNQTVGPISTAFQAMLVEKLTHYHTPVMDQLLVKLGPPNTLSKKETAQLICLLSKRTKDMGEKISASERTAAEMLPLLIRFSEQEALVGEPVETILQVVLIPKIKNEKADAQKA